MDAIIIAGGTGSRVRSITKDEYPKILIPVNGKAFIEYLLETLYSMGVRHITFAAGFKWDVLAGYMKRRDDINTRYLDWTLCYEWEPKDTGGAILNVLSSRSARPHSDPFLVLNGDTLIFPEKGVDCYEELYYTEPQWGKPACAMFTCHTHHNGQYDTLLIDYEDWVTKIEPGRRETLTSSFVSCGWYFLRQEFFKNYPKVEKLSFEKDMLPAYLEEAQVIKPIIIDEKQFIEIGTPEALVAAQKRLS